ncbi:uncharacterized protein LOC142350393 [Convolutriloba macropyga]|uniref:uncharacterized protein LOC142350393 n=1 Tax=Convolutriloba macropyga TaxID=536237 RepID=UPI003F528F28
MGFTLAATVCFHLLVGIDCRNSVLTFVDSSTGWKYAVKDQVIIDDSDEDFRESENEPKRRPKNNQRTKDQVHKLHLVTERVYSPLGGTVNLKCTGTESSSDDSNSVAVRSLFTNPDGQWISIGTDDFRYKLDDDGILTVKKVEFDDVGLYKCRPERVDEYQKYDEIPIKVFDLQLLDCRYLGCERPECDCVVSGGGLAQCSCPDMPTRRKRSRHSDDTSWALPGTGGCLVITMVIIVINAPVYYLWYKQNGYKVKKWLKRKKDKFCVVFKNCSDVCFRIRNRSKSKTRNVSSNGH